MTDQFSPELRKALRQLKLTPVLDTLPERLVLARQRSMPHQDFLELVLADEISRRDTLAAERRARVAHLDHTMVLEEWDDSTPVRFDRQLWNELCSLRFLQDASGVLVLGPVGVGKTMLANCLGHIAARRQHSVLMFRTERLLKRLKAARLEGAYDQELRRLIRVDLLILDLSRHRDYPDEVAGRSVTPLWGGLRAGAMVGIITGSQGRPASRPAVGSVPAAQRLTARERAPAP